jgi:PDZ domain-containing protein
VNIRRAFSPLRLAVAGVIAVVIALVILLTTSSNEYLLVPDQAHPLKNLVHVPHAKPADTRGGIYYVDVLERKASLLERLFPGLRDGSTLVQHDELTPPGVTDRQRFEADRLDMRLSQQVATAVALRSLGYNVRIKENGVRVALVYGQTHAAAKIRPDDVIVSADHKPVRSTLELHEIIARHKVGDLVPIVFVRDGVRHSVTIKTSADPFDDTRAIIGFQPQPALDLRVPFQIQFDLGNVGGPSAGLAFALQILEEQGRDVDHGLKVAATGVIAPDGEIGAIGAIQQKTIGARRAHVDVFLVPAGDNYRDARKYAHGLRIIPVKTFQQALRALATLPAKSK